MSPPNVVRTLFLEGLDKSVLEGNMWIAQDKGRSQVRVSMVKQHGNECLDLRLFLQGDDGKYHWTKNGVYVDTRHLGSLLDALHNLKSQLQSLPFDQTDINNTTFISKI